MSIVGEQLSEQARLVDGIRCGEVASESTFITRYRAGLVLMLEQRTRDRARAEDLAHDTLVTVLAKLRKSGIDDPEALTSFVYQTAKFIHIGWLRKKSNQVELQESFDMEPTREVGQETHLIQQQQSHLATLLINEMPVQRDREILFRFYVHEQAKPLICEALELSSQHFDRVLNRARRRFKEMVNRHDVDLRID